MPSSADFRYETFADCGYVIFIDGSPYAFACESTGGGLLGSGAASWIGGHESASSWETVGARTVLPGLVLPASLALGKLDPKTGMLQTTSATFTIIDHDNLLGEMFASEGRGGVRIAERVAPGITNLGSSLLVEGGVTADPRGMYLGQEAIGPDGQRRAYHCFPFQGIGFDHPVPINASDDLGLAEPDRLTELPEGFESRMVALYRLHRDHTGPGTGYQTWNSWSDAYENGDLIWVGKLRGTGSFSGNSWKLTADGVESLLKKQCGTMTPKTWMKIGSTSLTLEDDERWVACEFRFASSAASASGVGDSLYESIGFSYQLPASGTRTTYLDALNSLVGALGAGTYVSPDYGLSGEYGAEYQQQFRFTENGVAIGKRNGVTELGIFWARISLHQRLWRHLGWEIEYQGSGGTFVHGTTTTLDEDWQIRARELDAGSILCTTTVTPSIPTAPTSGYWCVEFATVRLGEADWVAHQTGSGCDNDGAMRIYRALNSEQPIILARNVEFSVQANNSIFMPPDPLVPYNEDSTAGTEPCTGGRYFVFKGKRQEATPQQLASGAVGEIQGEDFYAVGRVSYPVDFSLSVGGALGRSFRLETFLETRRWGLNYPTLYNDADWSGLANDNDWAIYCVPLNALSFYQEGVAFQNELEPLHLVFHALLVSTGTTGGYSGPIEDNPSYTLGVNDDGTIGGMRRFGSDVFESEIGLAIPHQLVESIITLEREFDKIQDGTDAFGGLCAGRFAYVGAFDSYKVIQSIVQPRGLMMTWKGGKFGVQYLNRFSRFEAETTITEDDLWGEVGDPGTTRPDQEFKVTGPIDKIVLNYRTDPTTGETVETETVIARDRLAKRRKGDQTLTIEDHSLVPYKWYTQAGASNKPKSWLSRFDRLWALHRANFYAASHYAVTLNVQKLKGQDLGIGSKVRLTNRWVQQPNGTKGVVDQPALVIGNELQLGSENGVAGEYYSVELLVFAQPTSEERFFMPLGRIVRTSGADVTLETDHLGHGGTADAARFIRPDSATLTGDAVVTYIEFDRVTWTLSAETRTVLSRSGDTLTLNAAFTNMNPYTDKYLVMAEMDDQDADGWVAALALPIVDEALEYGSGPTRGFPFVED